jgi:formate hydrogenlyase transcriptional activator
VAEHTIDTAAICELALEVSPSGIAVLGPGGRIAMVNRELERLFGYSREELVGQPVELLVSGASRPAHPDIRETYLHALDEDAMGAGRELQARRKDGNEFSIEIRMRPVRTEQGGLVLALVTDLTDRRRPEHAQSTAIDEQLGFERFVAELSGQFISLPIELMADAIRDGLGRICAQLDLDRSVFYSLTPDHVLFHAINWTAPGVDPIDTPMSATERFPWTIERVAAGHTVCFSTVEEIPSETDRDSFRAFGSRSVAVVPLSVDGRVKGALAFSTLRAERQWPPAVVHRLTVIASVFAQVLARYAREEAERVATAESQRLKEQLQVENVYLRQEARERLGLTRIVGQSPAVRRVLDQVEQVAVTDSAVLLLGETGTGKELFATQIHELGVRHARPMVVVNCAAIPPTLIESELFGRERGAFTGVLARQIGRFEMADHSTIFLDEIGDLPLDVQVKLLRVLEEKTIERLGSPKPIRVDVRVIAATHRNLERLIADGMFREDLYYRLNVFPIALPPLRERTEDIPLLVWRFVEEFSKAFGRRIDTIDKATFAAMAQYPWPGNIRELRNVVERAMIVATGHRLAITVPHGSPAPARRNAKLIDVEKEHIRGVLETTGWRIRGSGGAADRLGLKPTTLETRMAKLGLKRPGHA